MTPNDEPPCSSDNGHAVVDAIPEDSARSCTYSTKGKTTEFALNKYEAYYKPYYTCDPCYTKWQLVAIFRAFLVMYTSSRSSSEIKNRDETQKPCLAFTAAWKPCTHVTGICRTFYHG
eukprot:5059024-Pleurochrysis_carterae.AAC.1